MVFVDVSSLTLIRRVKINDALYTVFYINVKRPVTRSLDVYFDLHLNKRRSKQLWGWWFETLSRSLWRQCHVRSESQTPICKEFIETRHLHTSRVCSPQTIWKQELFDLVRKNCLICRYNSALKIKFEFVIPPLLLKIWVEQNLWCGETGSVIVRHNGMTGNFVNEIYLNCLESNSIIWYCSV